MENGLHPKKIHLHEMYCVRFNKNIKREEAVQKIKISDLRKVESSNIDLIGKEGDVTFIQFKNGSLYSYPNTTDEEFIALAEADSVGKQFFKSYKSKIDYTQLEGVVLAKKESTILELVSSAIDKYIKNGQGVEAGALKMFKAALIDNTKAKKPLAEQDVAIKYFKALKKQQEEYTKVGANTQMVDVELSLVESFAPKTPAPLSDEEVKAAVNKYIGDKGFTKKDMGSVIRYMKVALGDQNGQSIAKFVKELL